MMRESQGKTPAQGLLRQQRRQVAGDQRQELKHGCEDVGHGVGTGADPALEADSTRVMVTAHGDEGGKRREVQGWTHGGGQEGALPTRGCRLGN